MRSQAFKDAALRSEQHRAYVMIAVIVLVLAPISIAFLAQSVPVAVKWVGLVAGVVLLAIQLGVVARVRLARRRDEAMPFAFSVATVLAESLLPTGVILSHILMKTLPPFVALSSPPILAYALLTCLTTLRLRPWLCMLAGSVSSLTYLMLVAWVVLGLDVRSPTTGLPLASYFIVPLFLFATGLAAAWVAREARRYLEAALDEAALQRRMDRVEHDLNVASSIQRALLPREAPNLAGYDIAGWNRPADQTGGDYYDWHVLPDGNWMITLADVSGHGVGPALVTAACRAYVRASSSQHPDLGSLATRINALLAADLPEGRFVTMACVLLDPRTPDGRVALLSAGHGPIVLRVNATGEVRDILPGDMPLAIDAQTRFGPAEQLRLEKGDVLALVTDGFVEWSRPAEVAQEQFGIERLRASLSRHAHLNASDMIERIAADVATFAGDIPQQDDLTMVVVRRL